MPLSRRFRIERYHEGLRGDWNQAVRQARNGLFFFERGFLDYHGPRFADCSLMIYEGRKPLALLPAHLEGDSLVSHRGLPFAGWIVSPELCLRNMEMAFILLEQFLRAVGLRRLVVSPVPNVYGRKPCEEELWCLRQQRAVEVGAKVGVVMRARDFKEFATEKRKKLLKSGVLQACRAVVSTDIRGHMERVAEFLWERHRVRPLHTAEEMEFIAAAFPENVRIWEVWRDNLLVGGNLVFLSPHIVRSQHFYVCGDTEKTGGTGVLNGALLLLEEIQNHWWDFGTSMEPATGLLNPALHQFKESHGGRTSIQSTYEWNLDP